jgi:hypothetical protein
MRQKEIMEQKEEGEQDRWFNQARLVIVAKQTWREKRLAREENGDSSDDALEDKEESGEQTREVNKGVGKEQAAHEDKDQLVHGTDCVDLVPRGAGAMDVNMVFMIPAEFWLREQEVAALALGAERAVFEKVKGADEHMKPLFVREHLDRRLIGHMMVDGRASVNIMHLAVFKQLGHIDADLKWTNLSLSVFSAEPPKAQGIISKEVIVGSKTMPTTFFMVDVRGRYNVLLG